MRTVVDFFNVIITNNGTGEAAGSGLQSRVSCISSVLYLLGVSWSPTRTVAELLLQSWEEKASCQVACHGAALGFLTTPSLPA